MSLVDYSIVESVEVGDVVTNIPEMAQSYMDVKPWPPLTCHCSLAGIRPVCIYDFGICQGGGGTAYKPMTGVKRYFL